MEAVTDPVLARRARIARWVGVGRRAGAALFLLATVVFFAGFAVGFSTAVTVVVIGSLLLGSVVLAPAIVFGYAVRAADTEDREAGRLPPD